jgi:peptide/nickel transport system permease protein
VRKYTAGDYFLTFMAFLGLAIPEFMIALILLYISFRYFNQSVGGLFSPEYVDAPWSFDRFADLMAHLWIPIVIVGVASTAGLVRIMRANLMDELNKPYVVTARAKGLPERKLLLKYPVRVALNPFVSTSGYILPGLVSGEAIIGVVLSLPTVGPLLLRALQSQDMYLAGSLILMTSILTVIGTLLSDILLAWLDPRIRY